MIKIVPVLFIILLSLTWYNDLSKIEKAKEDIKSIESYCRKNGEFPNRKLLFVQKNKSSAFFQYDVNFWNPMAIGKAKISEFIPLPYAYSVKLKCEIKKAP